jgi:hypothetical protein
MQALPPAIEVYPVHHLPILKAYADQLGLVSLINRVCPTFYTRSGPVICGPFSINSATSRERYLIA